MEHLFRYEITFISASNDEEITQKGIICAPDYTEAVRRLLTDELGYGNKNIIKIQIEDMIDTIVEDGDLVWYNVGK